MKEFIDFNLEQELQVRNRKEYGMIHLAQRPNGSYINLPIMLVVGKNDGPVILADACNHGDEYEGVEGILETFQKLDPETMSGTFIGIPAVNLEAFAEGKRYNTIDFVPVDINRIYPGNPNGTMTHYITHWYAENILKKVDAMVTLHGGGTYAYLEPLAIYTEGDSEVCRIEKEMCEIFGFKVMWVNNYFKEGSGIQDEYMLEQNIPTICVEVGGQCTRLDKRELYAAQISDGLFNVMKYFKVIEGEVHKTEGLKYYNVDYIYANEGGLVKNLKKTNDTAKAGDTLAIITNIFGEEIDRIIAPYDCTVILHWTFPVCQPHNWIFLIGKAVEA